MAKQILVSARGARFVSCAGCPKAFSFFLSRRPPDKWFGHAGWRSVELVGFRRADLNTALSCLLMT